MKRRRKIIVNGIIVLILGSVVFWFFIFPFLTVRTPLAYPILRKQWHAEAVKHFPEKTAGENEAVGFYYNAGAMQAATGMELRLRFDRDSYNIELQRLEKIPISRDAKTFVQIYDKNSFWTARDDAAKFEMRVLHCRPTFYENEPSWNHGSSYGYAWNDADTEVIYWTSSW